MSGDLAANLLLGLTALTHLAAPIFFLLALAEGKELLQGGLSREQERRKKVKIAGFLVLFGYCAIVLVNLMAIVVGYLL